MDLNPRADQNAMQTALGWTPELSSTFTIAYGYVNFDMATDAAFIANGAYRAVRWFAAQQNYPLPLLGTDPSELTPGPLSMFEIASVSSVGVGTTQPFDTALEVCVGAQAADKLFTAWIWPSALTGGASAVVEPGPELFMGYEGSPIAPNLHVRCSMIPGTTPAGATVHAMFILRSSPQASAGGANRIRIPSPHCAPPFIATGASIGKHIFSDLGVRPYPSMQRLPFPRLFQTRAMSVNASAADSNFDARVLGGPWHGHLEGAVPTSTETSTWAIEALLASHAASTYTPPPIVAAGPDMSATLHTQAREAHGGLRFRHTNAAATAVTQLTLDYFGA